MSFHPDMDIAFFPYSRNRRPARMFHVEHRSRFSVLLEDWG